MKKKEKKRKQKFRVMKRMWNKRGLSKLVSAEWKKEISNKKRNLKKRYIYIYIYIYIYTHTQI
jgi:hypothetical protein